MAQKMLDLMNFKLNQNKYCHHDIKCDDNHNFTIRLSQNKYIRFYKSKIYKDFILTFNINNSKKIVLNRSMFEILRNNFQRIENGFMDSKF